MSKKEKPAKAAAEAQDTIECRRSGKGKRKTVFDCTPRREKKGGQKKH